MDYFQLTCLIHIPVVIPILFDLLGGFAPHYPQCVCAPPPCSAAATASATSISGATAGEQVPLARPAYIGQVRQPYYPPPYPGAYPYRHRVRRSTQVVAAGDKLSDKCSSDTIGEIIQQSMTSSLENSRDQIRRSLLNHYGTEVVVLCSTQDVSFTVTDGVEFCQINRNGISCQAFVF
ncbi:ground-like domain protein [Dictyocaulus viviparus]|uniref:Ground-like domain protein n=1 Tax=Dictyocaulus viviparus TaxID=29172 RepID=A0A0D8XIL2_DICVI|nr:ground-like domain protein [Dictyocaulus viviparus]